MQKKRFLSILLVVLLFAALLPSGVTAAGSTVSGVHLVYDADVIELNTAWTEGEVQTRLKNNAGTSTTSVNIDPTNCFLQYLYSPGNWYGIGDGQNQVSSERTYGYSFSLMPCEGYDWPEELKTTGSQNAADLTSFSVYVNGVKRTDAVLSYNSYWNKLAVCVPVGKPSAGQCVTGVTISDPDFSIQRGGTYTFTAHVSGTTTDKSVVWSVTGAKSSGTSISQDGFLRVGADETAVLTVRAAAAADSSKYDTRTITVTYNAPTVDSVTISPGSGYGVARGGMQQFTVSVQGTQTDRSVFWTLSGNSSSGTTLSQSGYLRVGSDESSSQVTIKATSARDTTKYAVATIKIYPANTVSSVWISYSPSVVDLSTRWTEGEVMQRARANYALSSAGTIKDANNSFLMYRAGSSWRGVGAGSEQVSADKSYALYLAISIADDYAWIDEITHVTETTPVSSFPAFSVYVNGVKRDDAEIDYNDCFNSLHVIVPVGNASVYLGPVITAQPKNCTVTEGGSAGFTVKASGNDLSYQWYCRSSSTGSWVKCQAASAKTATHKPAALPKYSGYQYKCVITNDFGTITSGIVTLTVVAKPTITAQPKNCTVAEGGSASFTVKASGATGYQWYCRSSSTGSWVKCQAASAKTATHKPAALPKYSGYQYKCVISRTVNGVTASVTSNIVTLTVISKPVITTQPTNVSVMAGKTATFKVAATGGALSYQWYYQKPGESAWTKVSVNGTSASYALTAAARHNGYKYKCVISRTVSGVTAGVTSNIVTLTVISKPVITTQPTNQTVVEGKKATFKVAAAGGALSYQWYYQKPGSEAWTKVSSNGTSATYTLTTAARHNGYKYKCVVTNASGSTTSSVVTLTVVSKPVITTQPKNVSVTAGNTATFKVAATGGGLSYQWWYLKPGTTTWVKVSSNGTSATYKLTTAARHNGYRYKCVVTNSAGSATSSIVTLTVK